MFVITISFDGEETYTADKTYSEIVAAYEDGSIPVAVYDTSAGTATLFYLAAVIGIEGRAGVVFQSLPNISGSGVSSQGFFMAETDDITFMETAYPGE